jgi:tRNA pseudouridine32 synthase / 23S rRNA pseudouridine746 synthase
VADLQAAAQLDLLHVDARWIIANKASGLLAVPGKGADKQDCLSSRIQALYPDALIVHRLDMATSGLMVLARGLAAQRTLSSAFANRQVHKRYCAVVHGKVPAHFADWQTIELPIRVDWPQRPLRIIDPVFGKPSTTRVRLAPTAPENRATPGGTRLELEPVTGRSHQLRIHLQALGYPIWGDTLYAPLAVQALAPRLLLHAQELQLPHPASGVLTEFWAPVPF